MFTAMLFTTGDESVCELSGGPAPLGAAAIRGQPAAMCRTVDTGDVADEYDVVLAES
jgi:hypothetical protein